MKKHKTVTIEKENRTYSATILSDQDFVVINARSPYGNRDMTIPLDVMRAILTAKMQLDS